MIIPMNYLKILLWLSFLLIQNSSMVLFAQINPPRQENRFGGYFQLYGPTVLGLNIDYHLINEIDLDFGIGINGDIQYGARYHPLGAKIDLFVSPFIGLYGENINWFTIELFGFKDYRKGSSTNGYYIPVGVEFYFKNRITLIVEIGYNRTKEKWETINAQPIIGALKIGYHL